MASDSPPSDIPLLPVHNDHIDVSSQEDERVPLVTDTTPFQAGAAADELIPAERPLLLVALTGYRLLCLSTLIGFGSAKAILASVRGSGSSLQETFDWLLGIVLAVM